MKTSIFVFFTMSLQTLAATISPAFLDRLALVESGRDDAAINEAEDAHGRFQIRAAYLADANHVLGTAFDLGDMHNKELAEKVVRAYLLHYGDAMERETGRTATEEDLARIHNGGPRGWAKDSTSDYWCRFVGAGAEEGAEP